MLAGRKRKSSKWELSAQSLKEVSTTELWWNVLRAQTELYIGGDLRLIRDLRTRTSLSSVLDLGCGPGDFLLELNKRYPALTLQGVDISAEHIRYAQTRARRRSNLSFVEGDILDLPQLQADLVTMRLVLQHLSDYKAVLSAWRRGVRPGGHVLVMEAYDALTRFEPAVPALAGFYAELTRLQEMAGGSRDSLEVIKSHLSGTGFAVVEENRQALSLETDEEKQFAVSLYALVAEVVRRKFGVRVDVATLIAEMRTWAEEPDSTGQIGTLRVLFKRVD